MTRGGGRVLGVAALALLASLGACGRRHGPGGGPAIAVAQSAAPAQGGASADMTAQDAIDVVKSQVDSGTLKDIVSQPYTVTGSARVECSQGEVAQQQSLYPDNPELRQCKSPNGYPPYFKTMPTNQTQCCQTKLVKVPPDVALSAAFSQTDGKWHVTGDFSVEGQAHHATWTVDKQTKTLWELPGGS